MAKRTWPQILHAAESWDSELESWRDNLTVSIPVPEPSTGDFADLPPADENDRGIAAIDDPTAGWVFVISNGASWERIPKRAGSTANFVGADITALKAELNTFLQTLRDAGVIAP